MKNIILDLDNTLYEYKTPHLASMQQVFKALSENYNLKKDQAEAYFQESRKKIHKELHGHAASHNRLLYFQLLLERINANPFHALSLYELYWDTFLSHMSLYPKAMEWLINCKKENKNIAVLTDLTAHIQYRKIYTLKIQDYIDYIITSEEVGIEKPNPKMFQKALDKLKCKPEEAVMIGDNFEKDIKGATDFGIKAIWFNPGMDTSHMDDDITIASSFDTIEL